MSLIVKTIAIVNSHGEILQIYHPGAPVPSEGPLPEDNSMTIVHITEDVNHGNYIDTKYWKDGEWKTREKSKGPYYHWENEAWHVNSTELMKAMRGDRNIKLQLSDWTQYVDSPLSDSKKVEWAAYRQALRDIPTNNSSVTDLDQVSWPTEPS